MSLAHDVDLLRPLYNASANAVALTTKGTSNGFVRDAEVSGQLSKRATVRNAPKFVFLLSRELARARRLVGLAPGLTSATPFGRVGDDDGCAVMTQARIRIPSLPPNPSEG
jgi:hypothetical protein